MMAASIVTTFRGNGGARERNLAAVLDWLRPIPEAEIIVVEQDCQPSMEAALAARGISYCFAFNPGPFNKSWGLNVGFRHCRAEVVVFADADLILNRNALESSIALCRSEFDAVKPYDRLIDLTLEETQQVLTGQHLVREYRSGEKPNREGIGEFICFCGGLFVVRREVFEELGGFDERFTGWGGEDDAMTIKLQTLLSSTHVIAGQTAWHLWHERQRDSSIFRSLYRKNCGLLHQYRRMGKSRMMTICEIHRQTMGEIHRYAEGGQLC
jgi:predicted glycosyltransferase involved in capsule biosynthesis